MCLNLKLESFILTPKKRQVCGGLDNQCYDISNSTNLRIFYFCDHFSKIDHFEIPFIILQSSPVDCVYRLQTAASCNLCFGIAKSRVS
jgi:hypothetical protein